MLWARVQVRTQTHSEKEWWDTGVSCEKWQPSLWSLFSGKTQSPPSPPLCLSGKLIYCGCVLFLSVRKSDVQKRHFRHLWEMTTDGFLKSGVIMIVPSARGAAARWNSPQTNTGLFKIGLCNFYQARWRNSQSLVMKVVICSGASQTNTLSWGCEGGS